MAPLGRGEQRERLDKVRDRTVSLRCLNLPLFISSTKAKQRSTTRHATAFCVVERPCSVSRPLTFVSFAQVLTNDKPRRLVWVDIGGGTGWNIEAMDAFHPIANFDAVYLVDLCEPLLDVARRRFARKGWSNVHCICADAASFVLPEPEWADGCDPKGSLSFVSFSYSLSMVNINAHSTPFSLLLIVSNRYPISTPSWTASPISYLLLLDLFAVVDFYTSGRASQQTLHERAIGGTEKECGWLSRWFWQIWFDFDHIFLGSQRRDYLEYKFGTVSAWVLACIRNRVDAFAFR